MTDAEVRRAGAVRPAKWSMGLAILLGFSSLACRTPAGPETARNVLMIVSDTLRADVLSCYGGPADTPNLCGLAARGTLFERSYSAAPWTLPSAVTMFTGFPPGVYRRAGQDPGRGIQHFYWVPKGEELLAERLAAEGWNVAHGLENRVAAQGGSLQGFEPGAIGSRRIESVRGRWAEALGAGAERGRYDRIWWLVERLLEPADDPPKPFFYLHWFDDPHAAYRPPEPFLSGLEAQPPGVPQKLDYYLGLGHRDRPRRNRRKLRDVADELSSAEVELLADLYRREVESVDDRVGILLAALERSGRARETLVVFTSDHGEGFGEHGHFLHGVSLYDEMVRVPLILAGPGVPQGIRSSEVASHVDLIPTVAARIGLRSEVASLPGRDLLEGGGRPASAETEAHLSSPDRLEEEALVSGRWKLVLEGEGANTRLYDLEGDPEERIDVAAEHPHEVDRLLRRLRRRQLAVEAAAVAPTEGDDELERAARETEDQLRAVGYID